MTLETTIQADADFLAQLGDPRRMRTLASYNLFDPNLKAELDELERETAEKLSAHVSFVSFVLDTAMLIGGQHGIPDEHWVAMSGGLPVEWSFCAQAVLRRAPPGAPGAADLPPPRPG